jgi:hypothetical protein
MSKGKVETKRVSLKGKTLEELGKIAAEGWELVETGPGEALFQRSVKSDDKPSKKK